MSSASLQRAREIMRANDRGGYTVPTAGLYPYQWNWDSAFAALGFACFDRERAWREIETLIGAQWGDGLIPHIVFRRDDPDYFPGPSVWCTESDPPSSGITQPPVLASVVRRIVESGDAADRERARGLFGNLLAWHDWFHAMRDPDGSGVIGIVHPWESGRDNCPDWDGGMNNIVVPADLPPYTRRDTSHVDASERPTQAEYDRYLTMVKFGRDHGWDQRKLVEDGPFFVGDPGMQFILMRADRDLLALAEMLGEDAAADQLRGWIKRGVKGCEQLWNPEVKSYCARDLRTGKFSDGVTNASMLAFYGGAGSEAQRAALFAHLESMLDQVEFALPSWDPGHAKFDSRRYWRGPVWLVVNYMVGEGLRDAGREDLAERLRGDSLRLVDEFGFYEYFDPLTGAGLGGNDFTWTAAIRLAWD